MQVLFVNPAGRKMVGLHDQADIQGKVLEDFFFPEDYAFLQQTIMPALKKQGRWAGEFRFRHFKTHKIVEVYFDVFRTEDPHTGKLMYYSTISRDITAQKQAQELILAKNKELQQVLYVASHDFRSPLVNINGYSHELQLSMKQLLDSLDHDKLNDSDFRHLFKEELDTITTSLQLIRSSARQMDHVLNGLLKLSRLGRTALHISALDMNKLLKNIKSVIEYQLKEANAELVIEELPACRGDETQLIHVFNNLIGNALKFRKKEQSCLITISGWTANNQSTYCVADNGIGIEKKHQQRIFEIFHRIDPAQTQGEGLGLTIIQQILSRLQGSIQVESEPGKGSKFLVSLPGFAS